MESFVVAGSPRQARKTSSSFERHMQRVEEHQQRRRRQRRSAPARAAAAVTLPGSTGTASPSSLPPQPTPVFRIGGKLDPGRFVSQHQQQFYILGFHDEERSERMIGGSHGADGVVAPPPPAENHLSHPMRLSFGSAHSPMRNTLSPVREHQDSDFLAIMQQRVSTNEYNSKIATKNCEIRGDFRNNTGLLNCHHAVVAGIILRGRFTIGISCMAMVRVARKRR